MLTGNGYDGDVLVTWGPEHSEDDEKERGRCGGMEGGDRTLRNRG